MKKQNLIFIITYLLYMSMGTLEAEAANPVFDAEEDLCYYEFILPVYPQGLRATWSGVHATYLDWHANDSEAVYINKNHQVSTESTSLLAHYAALRGDQAMFEQMYDLWISEGYFFSQKFQLEHWLLDPWGVKFSSDGNYGNASGEEVRMLEALKIAYDKFAPTGGRDYRHLAQLLAEGMKGVNGGQGNFEPLSSGPSHNYVYSTDTGDGGVDTINFAAQSTRYVRINCLMRNTPYGYSLWEAEVYEAKPPYKNIALRGTATASSVQGFGLEADKTIDGNLNTRWSSSWSDPQYLEIDLGVEKTIDKIVLHWESASAKSYNIDLNPYAQGSEVDDGYLLRPWFSWTGGDEPLSTAQDPVNLFINYNNFVSYYYAANWLGDAFYQNVIDYSLDVVLNAQNTDPTSPGKGLFKAFYDISTQEYSGENGSNSCSTMSAFDMAIRLGAYGHLVGNQQAIEAGQLFLDFIKTSYLNDGVIWANYDYDTGEPVNLWDGLVLYSFFAQLAIEYSDYDLAEKIIREQILPLQVDDSSDPGYDEGYYGAFKPPATKLESEQNIWKDASAFANLETLKVLHLWNNADKGSWQSSYPEDWTTVASVTGSDGGGDIVDFDTVNARYLRVLCNTHALPEYGFSMWTLEVFGPDMIDLALNKNVSVSSMQSVAYAALRAVDGDDTTRWSSEFKVSPQWIYVDLGEHKDINKVCILWESAYAVDYEIQAALIGESEPVHDVALTDISAPSSVLQGDIVPVLISVVNQGDYDESFSVTLIDITDSNQIGSQQVSLSASESTIVNFNWDTTESSIGNHALTAEAGVVAGETDIGDNTMTTVVTMKDVSANTTHVATIDMSLSTRRAGKNKFIKSLATITIVDAENSSVEGAVVYGSWSGATSDTDSGVTDTTGKVTLESDEVRNPPSGTTFTFIVNDVTKTDWTYDSVSNVETSGSIAIP